MMTKRFLKMTFLWYVNYRLYNFINVKQVYNFFFLYFNFVYGIIFPLSLETRS